MSRVLITAASVFLPAFVLSEFAYSAHVLIGVGFTFGVLSAAGTWAFREWVSWRLFKLKNENLRALQAKLVVDVENMIVETEKMAAVLKDDGVLRAHAQFKAEVARAFVATGLVPTPK